jgi:hypothetical protein
MLLAFRLTEIGDYTNGLSETEDGQTYLQITNRISDAIHTVLAPKGKPKKDDEE